MHGKSSCITVNYDGTQHVIACIFEMFQVGTFHIEVLYMSIYHRTFISLNSPYPMKLQKLANGQYYKSNKHSTKANKAFPKNQIIFFPKFIKRYSLEYYEN